jgi:predicted acetyltransferase
MLAAWQSAGEEAEPWVLRVDPADFARLVQTFADLEQGIGVPEGFVPSSTFWAYAPERGQINGAVNIRHRLNDQLLRGWGSIGYGVRPDARRQGYATQILHLALAECRALRLERVLLGCYRENVASAKTILKNGGVLENAGMEEGTGKVIQRYWIEVGQEGN